MHALATPQPDAVAVVIVAGVAVRIAAAVAMATLPAFPGVSPRVRLALALAITAAVGPAALREGMSVAVPWPLVVIGEAIVGGMLGMGVALAVGAAGWAGSLLGTAAGLSWADDFDPEGGGETAGIGRLAWWVGAAAFLSAGGHLAVVGGLLDGLEAMPVGTALAGGGFPDPLVAVAITAPTLALSLALTLALPALAAVVAFHLASAVCLRTVSFVPGGGLLQGLAAVVLLAAFGFGLDTWAGEGSTLVHAAVERFLGK